MSFPGGNGVVVGESRSPWVRGCGGCVLLLGLGVCAVSLLVGWAWLTVGTESADRREGGSRSEPQIEAAVVRIEAYLGRLHIEPAPSGGIRMEASHDPDSYQLVEQVEKDGSTLRYTVALEARRLTPVMLVRRMMGAAVPELRLFLPRDLPITLEIVALRTEVGIDLGGLALENVVVGCDKGPLTLEVSEPVSISPQLLRIRSKLSKATLRDLGHASPDQLDIDTLLGDLNADLTGDWRSDAAIRIIQGPGETVLTLPENARIEGLVERSPVAKPMETQLPTLRMDLDVDELILK